MKPNYAGIVQRMQDVEELVGHLVKKHSTAEVVHTKVGELEEAVGSHAASYGQLMYRVQLLERGLADAPDEHAKWEALQAKIAMLQRDSATRDANLAEVQRMLGSMHAEREAAHAEVMALDKSAAESCVAHVSPQERAVCCEEPTASEQHAKREAAQAAEAALQREQESRGSHHATGVECLSRVESRLGDAVEAEPVLETSHSELRSMRQTDCQVELRLQGRLDIQEMKHLKLAEAVSEVEKAQHAQHAALHERIRYIENVLVERGDDRAESAAVHAKVITLQHELKFRTTVVSALQDRINAIEAFINECVDQHVLMRFQRVAECQGRSGQVDTVQDRLSYVEALLSKNANQSLRLEASLANLASLQHRQSRQHRSNSPEAGLTSCEQSSSRYVCDCRLRSP